jgi:hypothetical protein
MGLSAKAAADPLAAATAETTVLIAALDGIAAAPLTLTQFLCARVLADAAQREVAQHKAEHAASNAEGRSACQPPGLTPACSPKGRPSGASRSAYGSARVRTLAWAKLGPGYAEVVLRLG